MKLFVARLALLCFTLDAATSLVASRPHYASSNIEIRNIRTRDVDTFDLYSRSIEAREPTPVDLAAVAIDLETRDVDELDVYSRDIEAREPTSADVAVAAFDLERRNPVGAIVDIAKMIVNVIMNIKKAFEADKEHRSKWTYELVGRLHAKDPSYNYMVCHSKHTYHFDGVQGKDWHHSHQELPVGIFHKTTGFEIYSFHGGTFKRIGDGGYLNWAYIGNVVKKSADGKELTFK